MKYYGLHFIGEDKTPLQVRVDTSTLQVFARSCPNGQWTAWRRLDVIRNPDGTLAEEVAEATHAKRSDADGRLSSAVKIALTGDAQGEAFFDGSQHISINVNIPSLAGILNRLSAIEKYVE